MAQKKGGAMPQTQAGLIRYFDEEGDSLQLDPKVVVAGITGLIVLELVMQWFLRLGL